MVGMAVITGGGSGIGRALARWLAARGCRVWVVGRRLEPLKETASLDSEKIMPLSADLSTEEGRASVVKKVGQAGQLSFLVHNAGVLDPVVSLKDIHLQAWQQHMAINLEAPLFLTRDLLNTMASGSRVLHLSSGAAHHGYRGWGAYCVSKAALHMLYQCLNEDLQGSGVVVGSVQPGVVDTPMQARVRAADQKTFPMLPRFLELKESGALLKPETVAQFLGWLLTACPEKAFSEAEWDIRTAVPSGVGWKREG